MKHQHSSANRPTTINSQDETPHRIDTLSIPPPTVPKWLSLEIREAVGSQDEGSTQRSARPGREKERASGYDRDRPANEVHGHMIKAFEKIGRKSQAFRAVKERKDSTRRLHNEQPGYSKTPSIPSHQQAPRTTTEEMYVQHGRSVYIRTAAPWEEDGSQDKDSLLRTNHKSFRTRNGRSEQTKPISRRERIAI